MAIMARLSFVFLVLSAIPATHAATRYVEKWGSDLPNITCSKTEPCLTIGHVLDLSGDRDKVVVGPGDYDENGLQITQSGLKLESTAGRHATTIRSTDGLHALQVTAEKVQIGKKGKGFTIFGGTGFGQAGLHINVPGEYPRIRVEGNRFGLPRQHEKGEGLGSQNYRGMWVQSGGGKIQIRNNLFLHNEFDGLYCAVCPRAIIRDNRAEANGTNGISTASADQSSLLTNLADLNAQNGIRIQDTVNPHAKVKDNILDRQSGYGIFARVDQGGLQIEGNITNAGYSSAGIVVRTDAGTYNSRMRKNLSAENGASGFAAEVAQNLSMEKNIAVENGANGFWLRMTPDPGPFKNNASIGNQSCGVLVYDYPLTVDRFFDVNSGLAGAACMISGGAINPVGPTPSKPPALGIKKAARVVGG